VLLACASANAQVNVTVDENGNVTSSSPFGPFLNAGTVTANPYALSDTALVYAYSSAYPKSSLVPVNGVVNIFADAAHTDLIDVIAFENGTPSFLIDMDLVNDGSKADVSSIPASILTLEASPSESFAVVNLTEGMCGITTYTPGGPNGTPNVGPGYMDDAGPAGAAVSETTYTFITETSYCAPDGGTTLCLLGSSLLVLGVLRRRLARA
jgi:hypothetical protein